MTNLFNLRLGFLSIKVLLLLGAFNLAGVRFLYAQQPGNSLFLDGTNDFVILPSTLTQAVSGGNAITVMYWFRGTRVQSALRFQNGTNFIIAGHGSAGSERHVLSNDGGTAAGLSVGAAAVDGRWHHIAFTWQRNAENGFKSYLDGQLIAQRNSANTALPSIGNVVGYLGCFNGTSEFSNGSFDEVKIFTVSRTQAELQEDMISSLSSNLPSNLVAYYKFNQGNAGLNNAGINTLVDATANNFTGTLTNFALNGASSNWVESYALVVPKSLEPTLITTSSFTANWELPATGVVENMVLEVASNPTFTLPVVGSPFTLSGTATSRNITGLQSGTYYYRVRANRASQNGLGAHSEVKSARLLYSSPGNALNFDGSNDYISIPHNTTAHNSNKITIEAWVFWSPVSSTETDFICSKGSNEVLEIHTGGSSGANGLRFIPRPGVYIDVANALIPNKWNFIAFMVDPSQGFAKTYINGMDRPFKLSGGSLSTALVTNTGVLNIGRRTDNTNFFRGAIDEFRIFSNTRTAAEVLQDMATSVPTNTTNLVAYYDFDHGIAASNNASATTLADLSNQNNAGTLINFGLNGLTSNWIESYAMVAPVSLPASNITSTTFTANWLAPAQGVVNNYLIDVSQYADFSIPISGSPFSVNSSTFTRAISGLQSNTNYYYRIRADRATLTGQGGVSITRQVRTINELTPPGNCLAFDGTGDYLAIPHASGINNQFANNRITVETWAFLRSHATGSAMPALVTEGWDGNVKFAIYQFQGKLYAGFHTSGWVQAELVEPIPLNRWIHIAATYDQATIKLYINGELLATKATTLVLPNGNDEWRIGRRWDYNECINGFLDELRIYNEALTEAQIRADMQDTTVALPQNLVAYYNFDQGAAGQTNSGITLLTDRSKNEYNATLHSFSLTGSNSNFISSRAMVVPELKPADNIAADGFTASWTAPIMDRFNAYFLDVSTTNDFTAPVSGSPFRIDKGTLSLAVANLKSGYYNYRVKAVDTTAPNEAATSLAQVVLVPYAFSGNALNFDGVNDFVTTPISFNNPQTFTIEAWFRTTKAKGGIVGFGNSQSGWSTLLDRFIYFNSDGKLYFGVYPGGYQVIASSRSYNDGLYHHVAATLSGVNGMRLYVDGELVASNPGVRSAQGYSGFWRIGGFANWSNSGSFFEGNIDDVRIWNIERTPEQIRNFYKEKIQGTTAGLLFHYNFDQGVDAANNSTTNFLWDKSSNLRDGILFNFALNGNTSNWVESYAMVVPEAVSATHIGLGAFTANFKKVTNGIAHEYLIDVSSTEDFVGIVQGSPFTAGPNDTSKVITGLLGGRQHFRVRANNTAHPLQGGASNQIAVDIPYTPPGNAISFDGINDHARSIGTTVGNFGTSNFTVEYWIKTTDAGAYHITKRGGCGGGSFWSLGHGIVGATTNQMYIELNNGGTNPVVMTPFLPRPINDNRWHHLALVREGVKLSFYYDGELVESKNGSGIANPSNGGYLYLGASSCSNVLDGSLDEIRLWNVARSQEQIFAGMRNIVPANALNLVAYYDMDQGVGGLQNYKETIVRDRTSGQQNLNLFNMTLEALNTNWTQSYAMIVPTQLEPTEVTTSGFTLNWEAPLIGDVTNYMVDVSLSPNFTAPISGSPFNVPFGTNTLEVTGLAPSVFYTRVRANKSGSVLSGEGAPSNIKILRLEYTPPGNALNFDGSNDFGVINKNVTGDFTIEYWVKTNQTGPNATHFYQARGIVDNECGNSNDFGTALIGDKLAFGVGEKTILSNSIINTGKWYHVAVTRQQSNGQMRLYINGQLEKTDNTHTGALNCSGQITLGATNNARGSF
ncbi:MAG: LamG-like jellyroll fold domain-containing protein, partial [Bacteroidota bacterium]|nr:LamG-like jellyroll fold domain-containing protein [Bacteroidota bacterium]